jgi:predicted nucleic acid-binding protein
VTDRGLAFSGCAPYASLAATALRDGLSLVTRNEADFVHAGVAVVNPWTL